MLYNYKKSLRGNFMAREKDTEFKVVTIRVPKETYVEYKAILQDQGKIVTYDIRNYMQGVIDEHKKGEK